MCFFCLIICEIKRQMDAESKNVCKLLKMLCDVFKLGYRLLIGNDEKCMQFLHTLKITMDSANDKIMIATMQIWQYVFGKSDAFNIISNDMLIVFFVNFLFIFFFLVF